MYELENGSKRLAGALERVAADSTRLTQLAHLLNYEREQLEQDIQALNDKIYPPSPKKSGYLP